MKKFLVPIILIGFSAYAQASKLHCEFSAEGRGLKLTKSWERLVKDNGARISEDVYLDYSLVIKVHIVYTKQVSSINIYHKKSGLYLNSDVRPSSNKFSLVTRSLKNQVLTAATVHCRRKQ